MSATLAHASSRRGGMAGWLLRDAYARLDRVGAISVDDADRLIALGVPTARVRVTGDTRYDQVWERARSIDRESPLLRPLASARPTLVAGSTWPADERVLLEAWARIARARADVRLVIAPHEPVAHALASIETWASESALGCARLSDPRAATADVVVVDRVGVLGDLYALATAAFVGGGFHAAGLHSVLEPAAFGVPVMFGPRHESSREARLLLDEDAAATVNDVGELATAIERYLGNRVERAAAGEAAVRVVRRGLGAAERSFTLVRELMVRSLEL